MYAQVEKPKENSFPTKRQESRAVANAVTQKKSNVKQGFGFVDNRPESIIQKMATIQCKKNTMEIGSAKYTLGQYSKLAGDIDDKDEFNDDEKLILTHWMKQEVKFENMDEFSEELNILLRNWEKQKVFYPTTSSMQDTEQDEDSTVRMYSSRTLEGIDKLFLWARVNGIKRVGFSNYMSIRRVRGDVEGTPFKGHFGDRAHTIKHWNQKKNSGDGVGLISIDLNTSGVTAIESEKSQGKIAKGGEGYQKGKIGLKNEKNFYSAAIGANVETWNKLKTQIQQIELHSWQSA